eukprot:jgi/Psemu1/15406/gm1.15406_g
MFHQPFFHLSQHHHQQQQQQQQHKQGLPSAHEGSTVFHDGEAELSSRMSAAAAAVAVASKLTGGNHSNNNNNHSSNHAWTKTDWYLGFRKHNNYYQHHSYQQQQQQQHQHLGTSRPATTGTVTSFLGMIRQQQHSNRRNATCCQDGDETETNRSPNCNSNCKRKRDRSDSDTATTNTTMTTPSSSLFFTDSYISEDDCTEEGTIDFSLDGVDENIHIRNEEEEDDDDDEHVGDAETESKDDHRVREPMQDGSDVEDWSDSTEVRRNATSVLVQEAAEKTITTTTKTKTTTTTTTTHTTTATATATAATDTKHKNKSIFVYPQVFVNAQESGAIPSSISNTNSTKSETGSKHSAPWIGSSNNGSLVSFDGPEVNSGSGIVTVTSPDTSVTTNPRHHSQQQQICCPCCASKEREIKRQRNELKHMGVLVKKLCGLLADTVRVQSSQKKRNHKSDVQKFLVTDEHEREHEQEAIVLSTAARQRHGVNDNRDSDTSTATTTSASLVASSSATSSSSLSLASSLSSSSSSLSPLPLCRQRKIGSRPIRSVGASCPRSKNHRIEVNGEVGTYSGPAMSTRVCSENESEHNYQRSGILQGCVVRFDNDELYVGSLSRNDTGSLTFHPPGTLYDANRVPKRRIR